MSTQIPTQCPCCKIQMEIVTFAGEGDVAERIVCGHCGGHVADIELPIELSADGPNIDGGLPDTDVQEALEEADISAEEIAEELSDT